MAGAKIDFKQMGIGAALQQPYRLVVPLNQREYSWQGEHALALFEDLNTAISSSRKMYFLGTIVLTRIDTSSVVEVADGQQRLATTTMLLSAIRDYLLEGSEARARTIEDKYLMETWASCAAWTNVSRRSGPARTKRSRLSTCPEYNQSCQGG